MHESIAGLRLAELLAARLCHELISPVGAIANGVEILEEEPDYARDAGSLIAQSSREARRRLQFFRVAYGAVGEVTVELAHKVAVDLFAEGRVELAWAEHDVAVPPGAEKLVCNLLVVAAEALPRGGRIVVAGGGEGVRLSLVATGTDARLQPPVPTLLTEPVQEALLTPRTVQAAFAALLAGRLGLRLFWRAETPGEVVLGIRD